MGSEHVLRAGKVNRYNQSYLNQEAVAPEGVDALVPYKGSVRKILQRTRNNLVSAFFYVGAKNLFEFQCRAKMVGITNAGLVESHPHDVYL